MTGIDESACYRCLYLLNEAKCQAFPDGIPERFLSGEAVHLEVVEGQGGEKVFKERGRVRKKVLK